jgi:hypothetical protein
MPILGVIASSKLGVVAGDFESIATVSVGSGGSATVSFTSIPSTYTHLQIRCLTQDDRGTYPISEVKLNFNSDTGTNYSYHQLAGDGGSIYGYGFTSTSFIQLEIGGTTTGGTFGSMNIDVLDYANTNKYKTTRALCGEMTNASYAGYYGIVALNSGNWRSTSAITSITLASRFATKFTQYSHFALYGIRSA